MEKKPLDLFKAMLTTPSPSGYEAPVQQLIRDYAKDFADEIRTDVHGNVIAIKNPDAPIRVMLAGHCDQIGMIIQHIDDKGFVYCLNIGGWDPMVLLGQRMTVWAAGGPIPAVIARKPIHLLTEDERGKAPKIKDLWLDIGAKDKEEAEKMVKIGDAVTVELYCHEMANQRIFGPGMDDKSGAWVVIEALRRADSSKLKCGLYAVSTVQEEVGLRGAQTSSFGVDPHVGIAVDVTFSTDCPTIESKEVGEVSLGAGPVITRGPNFNHEVVDRLIRLSEENKIDYQLNAAGRPPGTDANAIQVNRAGVAAGLVSIPNRYMHSPVEVVSLEDMDRAATLLARFAETVTPDCDFTP